MPPKRGMPPSPPPVVVHTGSRVEMDQRGRPVKRAGKLTSSNPVWKFVLAKLAMEFFGTALLCFTVAVVGGANAPLAIASTLLCVIYAGGHISGAHYNPAVSLAIWVRGKLSFPDLLLYIFTQLLAGAAAGICAKLFLMGSTIGFPAVGATGAGYGALICEAVLTFALCHTVLHVATTAATANNSFYGLAIGFTVLSGAVSVGGVSGGAFNPAVGMLSLVARFDITSVSAAQLTQLLSTFMGGVWIYFAGPMGGGLLAGLLFRLTHPGESAAPASAPLKAAREAIAPFLIEIVGTFLLVFTVGAATSPSNGAGALVPLGIGAMLMAQVYAGGATSGAHYNPAVTLAVYVRKALSPTQSAEMSLLKSVGYVVAQLIGASGAMALTMLCTAIPLAPVAPASAVGVVAALIAEAVGTFLLCVVVLQTATSPKTAGNSFFGLAIGLAVTSMAITLGPLSGGAFNPAVGALSTAATSGLLDMLRAYNWVYAAGPLAGGLIAALFYRASAFDEFATPPGRSMV